MSEKVNLTIEFSNQKALEHFASWLCESGEQDYWMWMECREQEEKGDITATSFHYHGVENEEFPTNDNRRYGNFMEDNIIRSTCGRSDND